MDLDYVLVVGQGRSGTNWLLRLFDLSPETFCRNESNEIAGSPLAMFEVDRTICREDPSTDLRQWEQAVAWSASHMGERDHRIVMPKRFVYGLSRRIGLCRVASDRRWRKMLRWFMPSLGLAEWTLPWWLGSKRRLAEALPVLKLVQVPGWVSFVLRHRPKVAVFHIIRHPGGFLNSWANRYLASHDERIVRRDNHGRLRAIAAEDSLWAERFGDIGAMSVEESELWYWRYACEEIDNAGQGRPQYRRVIYEELACEPVAMIRRFYEAIGLVWGDRIEDAVCGMSENSARIASAWQSKLSEERLKLVARILVDSPMYHWWPQHDTDMVALSTAVSSSQHQLQG